MIKEALNDYLNTVYEVFSSGEAREESYYPALETFIKRTWKILRKKEVRVIVMPKKTDVGNPDMVIRTPDSRLIGYIEAKNPGKDLDEVQETEQIKRYNEIFHNFILTNFLEFRFYRFGQKVDTVFIGRQHTMVSLTAKPVPENHEKYQELFKTFFHFTLPCNLNAKTLAEALAIRTRFIRDWVVMEELDRAPGNDEETNHITGFYNAFKTYLIHGINKEEFADLYSQTLTFGLFIAATRRTKRLKRENAVRFIPQTSGLLHDMFEFISMGNIPAQLECSMNDIVEILNSVNPSRLLNEYYFNEKGDDPILHFYETFLIEYNPRVREKRGVYYTPAPVVSFIVRSIHIILKEKLNRPDGLADAGIKILDPAAGTSAFLAETALVAVEEYTEKYGEGMKMEFAHHYLLNNLYGFEELMAPYAVGHLKMSYILGKIGVRLQKDERFNVYLTNTLEMEDIEQSNLPGMSSLSTESRLAGVIKKKTPIMVVLGNPPYAGHSLNNSDTFMTVESKGKTTGARKTKQVKVKTWIGEQIENYKFVDGKRLEEKNIKWLQDDYVKFIRFAQTRIEENGEGVVGFITNHAYLDNPTFRGMRQSLMNTFDEIYILDLHGNALKKEKCPDGSKDENVFDIRQGVAIALFIKGMKPVPPDHKETGCRVYHADAWGLRDEKYNLLHENDISTLQWESLSPWWEFYLFKPGGPGKVGDSFYHSFYKVTDIFPVHSVGIVTGRDELTIKYNLDSVYRIITQFPQWTEDEARGLFKLGNDTRDWRVKLAQKDIIESGMDRKKIVPILYRPFDIRFTYFTGRSRGFHCMPRPEVMKQMLLENIGLITVRQVAEGDFNHSFVTDTIVESRVTTSNRGIAYIFPLYLYLHADKNQKDLFQRPGEPPIKQPNINPRVFELLTRKAGFSPPPAPEQIFYYIYAVLFSNRYREKYNENLKIDFPRIPFTTDKGLFIEMGQWGKRLAELHLMKSPELNETDSRFDTAGSNRVEKRRYESGRVYINNTQYFSDIPREVWEYKMAGYQVMDKWLKSHQRRPLNHDEVRHFIRMARGIRLTIRYQEKIDTLYPRIEESLID
jgi:predicted helicase